MSKPKIFLSGEREKSSRYVKALSSVGFDITFDDYNASDALCLCGGGDISPCLYGAVNISSHDLDLERDVKESYYLRKFFDKNKPIIAVCRGLQVVNVYFGGSLCQNVCGHSQIGGEDVYHRVKLYGYLAEIYGETALVNSAHHQVVSAVGEGLSITAMGDDGVIEGLSIKNLVAFQFHPERLFDKTDGSKIFSRFYSDNFGYG